MQPVCLEDLGAGETWERKERWVGGRNRGTIREGGALGGSRGVARGTEGEAGWGCWHHSGLLPQLPVPRPGRGRDQKDNRVRRGARKGRLAQEWRKKKTASMSKGRWRYRARQKRERKEFWWVDDREQN